MSPRGTPLRRIPALLTSIHAAMLMLAHAEISAADRQAIAWDNLCRLLEEASLE